MDVEYIKSLVKEAEIKNRSFVSEAASVEDATLEAHDYAILLYQGEEILNQINELYNSLGNNVKGFWTPSGEDVNLYMTKCYRFAEKEDFIPAVYQAPVFFEWSEQLLEALNGSNPDTLDLITRSVNSNNHLMDLFDKIEKEIPSKSSPDVELKIKEAKDLLFYGKVNDAFTLLSKLLLKNPENEEVNFLLGICSILLKKYKLALNYFIDSISFSKEWESSIKVKLLPDLIRIIIRPKKQYNNLLDLFKAYVPAEYFISYSSGDGIDLTSIKNIPQIIKKQSENFDKNGYYRDTSDHSKKIFYYAVNIYASDVLPFVFIMLGRNYYLRENLQTNIGMVYNRDIYDSTILQAMGVFLNQAKLYNESKYFFIQSILVEENNHQAYQGLGDAFRYTNDFAIAIKHYEKCLKIMSSGIKIKGIDIGNEETFKAEYYYCLGMSYQGLKDNERASEYFFKAKQLPNNYYFGFIHDGIKDWDELLKKVSEIKKASLDKGSVSEETTCNVVNSIHAQLIELLKKFNVTEFSKQLSEKFDFAKNLEINSKACFDTAEILFFTSPHNLPDYSHVMVEYCKVVEIELFEKIISKLSNWTQINQKKVTTGKNLQEDINKFERITLGNYPFLFKEKSVKEFISEVYDDERKKFIFEKLGKNIYEIIMLRNDSAHLHTCSFEKVLRLRAILLDSGILKGISKL